MSSMEVFYVDQEFDSYAAFRELLTKFEAEHYCKFSTYKSESSGVKNDPLQYNYITLTCKQFGDKRFNPNLTGERPRQKTYKVGCAAELKLSKSSKRKKLILRSVNLVHNHPCNRITYVGYPENRRLSDVALQTAEKLQKVKVKPTLIRPLVKETQQDSEKLILGRDISNIRTKQRLAERGGRSDEEMLQMQLEKIKKKDPAACAQLKYDSTTKEVLHIFIQTSDMRECLQKFPEVLLMDITYKINKNRMPVCLIEVMDGEGSGCVVAYAFLANEMKDTLTEMLMLFVEASGPTTFSATQCVVVDKDFSEIGALRQVMPHAAIHICSVHCEKNFKLHSKGEPNKKDVMKYLKAMIYSENEEKFQSNYEKFLLCASSTLIEYIQSNWLDQKEAWSLKDKVLVLTLRNHTTNRVESRNQKLKVIFDVDSTVYDVLHGLVDIIQANKKDDVLYRDHETLAKKVYINKCTDPEIQKICNDLTDFAAKIVCEQLHESKSPSPFPNKYKHDSLTCSCTLFKTMKLTCRHIMRFRKQAGIPRYSKDSIIQRWWKSYNMVNDADQIEQPIVVDHDIVTVQPRMPGEAVKNVLKPAQKYHKVTPVTQKLNSLASDSGTKTFYQRLQVLADIAEAWSLGSEVAIVHLHPYNKSGEQVVLLETSGGGPNDSIIDDSDLPTVCCTCGVEAGDHHCEKCEKVVHAIPPCSEPAPGSEEKFGQLRICSSCQENDRDVKPLQRFEKQVEVDSSHDIEEIVISSDSDCDQDGVLSHKPEFVLQKVPVRGKPSGRNNTIHNGRKQYGKRKDTCHDSGVKVSPNCCICGNEAGNHHCQECGNVVHAIEPCSKPAPGYEEKFGQPRICCLCEANEDGSSSNGVEEIIIEDDIDGGGTSEKSVPFKLSVVRTKGRQKVKRTHHNKWNFKIVADSSSPVCCVCKGAVEIQSVCVNCQSAVHGVHPCSNRASGNGRICNFCEAAQSANPTRSAFPNADGYDDMLMSVPESVEMGDQYMDNRHDRNSHVNAFHGFHDEMRQKRCQEEASDPFNKKKLKLRCETEDEGSLPLNAERHIIESEEMGDELITSALAILSKQFGDIAGLQFPAEVKTSVDIAMSHKDTVQIFHDESRGHWVLIVIPKFSVEKRQVYVFDSKHRTETRHLLTSALESTIAEMCNEQAESISVIFPPCQQQGNFPLCGYFAIAFCVEFCFTRRIRCPVFNVAKLKCHFLECLKNGYFETFPKSPLNGKSPGRSSKKETILVYCTCRMPEHFDTNQIQCDECKEYFHFQCVGVTVVPDNWVCAGCLQQ